MRNVRRNKKNGNNAGMASCRICRVQISAKNVRKHMRRAHSSQKIRVSVPRSAGNTGNTVNSGIAPNMRMKAMLNKELHGLTPLGKKYMMRVLHPNDETEGSGCMVPDNVDTGRVDMELRDYQVFSYVTGGGAPLTADTWDIIFMILPFSDVPIAWSYRDSGGDSQWRRWQPMLADRALYPGSIHIGSQNEGSGSSFSNDTVPAIRADNSGYRQVYKGVTFELNRSTLYDQGIVTAGQLIEKPPNRSTTVPYRTLLPTTDASTLPQVPYFSFENLPLEEGDIIRWCPQATQWEAKKGVYMPMRQRDTVNLFDLDTAEIEFKTSDGSIINQDIGSLIKIQRGGEGNNEDDDDFIYTTFQPPSEGSLEPLYIAPVTGGLANQAPGVVLFRGIHKTAQVVLKSRVGVEVIPKYGTALHTKIAKPAYPDPLAITSVPAIAGKLPVAFEHRFNSLGDLLGVIKSVAQKVLPTLAPWLNKLLGGNYVGDGSQDV